MTLRRMDAAHMDAAHMDAVRGRVLPGADPEGGILAAVFR